MESTKSNSVFVLKLIGSLFSLITLLMAGFIIWMIFGNQDHDPGNDYRGFMVSSAILTIATATIAVFIWWIVSNKRKFLNYE